MSLEKVLSEIIPLSDSLKIELRKISKIKSLKKNEYLLNYNENCNYLSYVNNGALRGFYFHEEKEITNWFSLEGDFATSFYPFISRTKSYETIQALEDSNLTCIAYEDLQKLYSTFPETERIGRIILEEYYSKLEERLINIQFKSAKERYNQLMTNRPKIIQRVALGHLASYLGITQETLSRIRAGN